MRAASHAGLTRPIGDLWRKPPRCKERVILRRLQTERHVAQLRRFIALCHAISQLRFVWPKSFVPIAQNRKDRQENAIQTAARDLIGSSKRGSAKAKISMKKYPQRACQTVRAYVATRSTRTNSGVLRSLLRLLLHRADPNQKLA